MQIALGEKLTPLQLGQDAEHGLAFIRQGADDVVIPKNRLSRLIDALQAIERKLG
jgi:hypothetical protein